jgi:hypothetical protein
VAPAPPPPPPPAPSASDFDISQRRIGIGYAGVSQVPIGGPAGTITAPAIGVRAWISQSLGFDAALGLGVAWGSTEANGTTMDLDPVSGFAAQFGFPINLATGRHVLFQVIPRGGLAYGRTSMPSPGVGLPATDFSGFRGNLGVRSGLEIFWGFIGLPELSLSATVGLETEVVSLTQSSGTLSSTTTLWGMSTTVQASPWEIFTSNLAARYYF